MTINEQSLAEKYESYFKIGAAINEETLERDRELLAHHFNSITAENDMKPEILHPEKDTFDFEVADSYVNFAKENNMAMRGHTLVWHNQTPDWFFEDAEGNTVGREVLIERMKDHIEKVMTRYKDEVLFWDVTNEVIEDHEEYLLRKSKWLEIIGDDFIEIAYKHAMKVNPKAKLFYNDYHATKPAKRKKIVELITNLREKGVRIDGVGLQGHWNVAEPAVEEIREALDVYSKMDLDIHITELDVSVFVSEDKRRDLKEPLPGMMEEQANRYDTIFSLFREYKEHIESVTFWGVTDYYTWLDHFVGKERTTWPFLFDAESRPKKGFYKVIDF